jgi:hypothetical protein
MDSRPLVETALRVLTAWSSGRRPDPADVETLQSNSPAALANLAIDEIACEIIHRESGRVLQDCRQERKAVQSLLQMNKTA